MTDRYPIGEVLASGSKVVVTNNYRPDWVWKYVSGGEGGYDEGAEANLITGNFLFDIAGDSFSEEPDSAWYFWDDDAERENIAWQVFTPASSQTITQVKLGLWDDNTDSWYWVTVTISSLDVVAGSYYSVLVYGSYVESSPNVYTCTIQVEIKAAGVISGIVETLPATRVSNLNATLNGNYPGSQSAQLYVEIRIVGSSADPVTFFVRIGTNLSFSSCIAGLTPLTLYSYRAIAKIDSTSYYGEWVTFTTINEPLYPIIPDEPTYTTDPSKFALVPKRKLDL